jgi:hypothetical protein
MAQSYVRLGDNALRLVRNHEAGLEASKRQEALWNETASIRILLKGLESRARRDFTVVNKLLSCLVKLSNINDFPAAPVLFGNIKPSVFFLTGDQGITGDAGLNGDDANIVVAEGDGEIEVIETAPGGVKTYTLSLTPYTQPTVSISVDKASITSPASIYREIGTDIAIPLSIVLTKGRDDVTTSVITNPGALNAAYQTTYEPTKRNLVNANGSESFIFTDTSQTASETYTLNLFDGTASPIPTNSGSIVFSYPILEGNSAGTSITYYTALTKVTQADGGISPDPITAKTVTFSGAAQYFWFGYPNTTPVTYGDLTTIRDQNGFDVTSAWTKIDTQVVTSVGLDNNWVSDGATVPHYTFYRTTLSTTISGNYTFYW